MVRPLALDGWSMAPHVVRGRGFLWPATFAELMTAQFECPRSEEIGGVASFP
jgi:hypothetical protein